MSHKNTTLVPKKAEKKMEQRKVIQKTNCKIIDLNQTISVITLSVIGLNTLIKRQRLSNWIKKEAQTT